MSKKKPFILLVTFLILLFAGGCSTQSNGTNQSKPTNTIRVTYQIKDSSQSLGTKKVSVKKGAKVETGLKKAWPTKIQKGMVTEINGHKQNNKNDEYWLYTINGKKANKGVAQQQVHNKNKIVFKLEKVSQ